MFKENPFYFSSVRGLTAIMGTLFNNIKIARYTADGTLEKKIKVPLAYGPADKTITMLQQAERQVDPNGLDFKIVLPRMAFELSGMNYDSSRKTPSSNKEIYVPNPDISFNSATAVNTTDETITINSHGLETGREVLYRINSGGTAVTGLVTSTKYYVIKVNNNKIKLAATAEHANAGTAVDLIEAGIGTHTLSTFYAVQFNAVPYTFEYSLYIFVKYIDDGLQIIEQILPYFSPFYSVTKKDLIQFGINRDVNITLTSVSSEDIYEGSVADDRTIQWTLTFTANSWVYPPISDSGVIKTVDVNFYDLDGDQKLVTTTVSVNPITAERDDEYTIDTTITEY